MANLNRREFLGGSAGDWKESRLVADAAAGFKLIAIIRGGTDD